LLIEEILFIFKKKRKKSHKMPLLSVKEYIEYERKNEQKYEYHDGKIFALAGGTLNHGLLCGNIYAEIRRGLKAQASDCKPLLSEIKLNISKKNNYVYPDTMVVCGELEMSKEDENAVTNPILIVEVLSKSTAEYDRGDKFHFYRQIASLEEYVLIEQDKAVVEIYYKKKGTDLWSISRYEGISASIKLQSIGVNIKMQELYFDVDMGTEES